MAKLYTVKSIVDRVAPAKGGGFQEEVMITFVTENGYEGRLSLPKVGLTAEKVQKALETEALKYESILKL